MDLSLSLLYQMWTKTNLSYNKQDSDYNSSLMLRAQYQYRTRVPPLNGCQEERERERHILFGSLLLIWRRKKKAKQAKKSFVEKSKLISQYKNLPSFLFLSFQLSSLSASQPAQQIKYNQRTALVLVHQTCGREMKLPTSDFGELRKIWMER